MQAYVCESAVAESGEAFAMARQRFAALLEWMAAGPALGMTRGEVEERAFVEGTEVLRLVMQGHVDARAAGEERLREVADADGRRRGCAEPGRGRVLTTRFGDVVVERIAYPARGRSRLHPADAVANLPEETHSHGLRRLAAVEATRGSFGEATAAVERATGVRVGKRQVEQLTVRAAADVDAFYAARAPVVGMGDGTALVLTFDAKGVVMRPDALREPTARAAASRKLAGRLSRGEKRCRKRMAEVAGVYDCPPVPRTVDDILPADGQRAADRPAPRAAGKWLTASVTDDTATVIAAGFAEAARRDPDHTRDWVALVDGNTHQIDRIRVEARARKVEVTVIIDFIHVCEYLWKAAWCFFDEGDPKTEQWVRAQARQVLSGRAGIVAAAIRRKATYRGLDPAQRKGADEAATYLLNKKRHLDYPTALASGWPIATGVIEGACRHLVKDRMDITGARWGLESAEAVAKLRALIANGDLDAYWTYHIHQEQQRIHNTRYKGAVIPTR